MDEAPLRSHLLDAAEKLKMRLPCDRCGDFRPAGELARDAHMIHLRAGLPPAELLTATCPEKCRKEMNDEIEEATERIRNAASTDLTLPNGMRMPKTFASNVAAVAAVVHGSFFIVLGALVAPDHPVVGVFAMLFGATILMPMASRALKKRRDDDDA